jgi:predicted naringenin-chalcone synthase
MKPKIISIGFSVPENSYSQKEVFDELKYKSVFWQLFQKSNIDTRHFWVPIERIRSLSFQEQQDEYRKGAVQLGTEAVQKCLDGGSPNGIKCLTFSSCTGYLPGPTAAHYIGHEMNLAHDTYYLNIGSMGCEGGFPGMKRAADFTMVSGKTSIAVACELASCSYFPEIDGKADPENHYELARSNSIFADAAAAVLVGYDDDPRHPEIIDTETYTDTKYLGDLGYVWRDGRLRVLLSRYVPDIAPELVNVAVSRILERNELKSIEHWIVHAAGSQVLDNIRDKLGLPEEKLAFSRKALRLYGNCSSTTIGIIGKLMMEEAEINPGEYGLVVSLGPGMTAGCTLLRW